MSVLRYYEDELAYLRELGDAFGRANPQVAGLLSKQASDPDVERLLEGFAFLTSRLRARLDEQLPELSQGMLALLWPHYLRPVPSMSIVEFQPSETGMAVRLPAGTALASRPVEGIACQFRTALDQAVIPGSVTGATLQEFAASARLDLTLTPTPRGRAASLVENGLRLFIHDRSGSRLGVRLLAALLTEVDRVELSDGSNGVVLPGAALRQGGLAAEDAVLPWPNAAFPGYRILQEYLAFPERFQFVDLPPVAGLSARAVGQPLEIRIQFRRPLDLPGRVTAELFRANCGPVINLREMSAEPIRPERDHVEYRLTPASAAGRYARVHSVLSVRGAIQGQAERIEFPPFETMRHLGVGAAPVYYRLHQRPAVLGRGVETWITFVDDQDRALVPRVDSLSIQLLCTDGELAELVPIGGIDQPGIGSPATMPLANITPVTAELPPPVGGDLLWRLVSGLARGMRPLEDIEALRAMISSYDFRSLYDEQARRRLGLVLDSLLRIETTGFDLLIRGVPARGRRVTLAVAESGLGGPAEVYLFGAVLDAFLGVYAGLNTATQLVVEGTEAKFRHVWPVRGGGVPLL